jgi:hypothetical protein
VAQTMYTYVSKCKNDKIKKKKPWILKKTKTPDFLPEVVSELKI